MAAVLNQPAPHDLDAWNFVETDEEGAVFISDNPANHDRLMSESIMRTVLASDDEPAALSPSASPSKPSLAVLKAPQVFTCTKCKAHLASATDLESKAFRGRHGPAYLFRGAVNTALGPVEERKLLTGLHTVRDVTCTKCTTLLGWKYESAAEVAQKWKEGKFILEKAMIEKTETGAKAD